MYKMGEWMDGRGESEWVIGVIQHSSKEHNNKIDIGVQPSLAAVL
jgi:hypothetical protein